ncbi:MAG: ATP-binding cassette domain-containing protein [Selenomonas sp.]|uniref:ATP-binding cassette domain-containing protein n=1 Tax=Selenomonas sp. TaxID=2053611 RepID=UPI0025DB20FD|nr:ATP-binding cassette domain-containing protein [Selenomonas sp.]MCI6233002.1 ATP-binding cassette domain-containing protein [Selenomonas sp.]
MMAGTIVEAAGLVKTFHPKKMPAVTALDHINLSVRTGELTALVGPDGAGKTTFLRLVCGLMDADEGRLTVGGMDVAAGAQAVQDILSYMPQKFGLYEDLTVAENMTLYADLHGVPQDVRKSRFARLLEMTGIAAFTGRLAGKLSGGMKQKLGLACTLVRSPKLLILDEPTVGVDPLSRRELWEILQALTKQEHLSVLVSTAYMDEAALCQTVHVFNHGRILASGTPEELRHIADGRCMDIAPTTAMPMRMLQSHLLDDPGITDAVPVCGKVHFITRKAGGEVAFLSEHPELPAATPSEERLEDAFMILLKEDEEKRNRKSQTSLPSQSPCGRQLSQRESLGDEQSSTIDITVRDLVKKFGDFTAVSHTSFDVHRGEVFGLLGPNGAGKTTTFRMLCGLLPLTSGKLSVAGVDLRTARTEARRNIGYVAQKFSLYSQLTVYENLRFFGGTYGIPALELKERIQEVMEEFDLTDRADHVAGELPGGYKQRLSMAAALIHRPKILFLDEPTSGINPLARRTFWQQIAHLSAKGTTIIITTHFMDEAEYCDRMMIQDHGEMLVLGSPSEIRERMQMPDADMNAIFIAIVEQSRAKQEEEGRKGA